MPRRIDIEDEWEDDEEEFAEAIEQMKPAVIIEPSKALGDPLYFFSSSSAFSTHMMKKGRLPPRFFMYTRKGRLK